MMQIKTTKQIVQSWVGHGKIEQIEVGEIFVDDSDKEVWVCLEDLKKQITALAKREDYKWNEIKQFVLDDILIILDLCNSSEQNVSNLCEKDINAKDSGNSDVVVSGEHNTLESNSNVNTGEDNIRNLGALTDEQSISSSPVQNPDAWYICPICNKKIIRVEFPYHQEMENILNKHMVECANKYQDVQKKCTCPESEECKKVYGTDIPSWCSRCGGAL